MGGQRRQHSWWRSVYNRISQSGPDTEDLAAGDSHLSKDRKPSRSNVPEARRGLLYGYEDGFDDPPPLSVIRAYQSQHRNKRRSSRTQPVRDRDQHDVLAPLPVFRDPHHQDMFPRSPSISKSSPLRLPAPYSPNIPSGEFVRSDSLLGRIFPPSAENMLTTTSPQRDPRLQTGAPSPEGLTREFRSSDATFSPPSPARNSSPPSRHRSHRRESASHRPPIPSPPFSLVTPSPSFPVLNTPRRNSSHHGLIVNPLTASPIYDEVSQPDRYPLFHPATIPQATKPHSHNHHQPHTPDRFLK